MATTTKVSELAALTTTDGAEELLINDGGTSKKVTIANLLHDESIDSDHYVDGSIDNAHLADDAVDSDEIAAGAIDTAHIGNLQVTAAKVAADVATQAELDAVSVIANASATTGKAIAMAIVFGS